MHRTFDYHIHKDQKRTIMVEKSKIKNRHNDVKNTHTHGVTHYMYSFPYHVVRVNKLNGARLSLKPFSMKHIY